MFVPEWRKDDHLFPGEYLASLVWGANIVLVWLWGEKTRVRLLRLKVHKVSLYYLSLGSGMWLCRSSGGGICVGVLSLPIFFFVLVFIHPGGVPAQIFFALPPYWSCIREALRSKTLLSPPYSLLWSQISRGSKSNRFSESWCQSLSATPPIFSTQSGSGPN